MSFLGTQPGYKATFSAVLCSWIGHVTEYAYRIRVGVKWTTCRHDYKNFYVFLCDLYSFQLGQGDGPKGNLGSYELKRTELPVLDNA